MPCILLSCLAAFAACNPPPPGATTRNPSPVSGTAARESSKTDNEGQASAAPSPTGRGTGDRAQATKGSLPEAMSAAGSAAPAPRADSPAQAQGRRTLSTAFVRVGPDGRLTVELRNGRAIV